MFICMVILSHVLTSVTRTCCLLFCYSFVFFFKQKTAYEMRIRDWSSDVCSSDLLNRAIGGRVAYFTAGGPSLFQSCEEVPEPVNLRMAIEPCRTLGNHIVPHNRVGYRAFRNGWFPSACQLFGWRLNCLDA